MSANTSQRKLHGAVMGATVSDFTGWLLVVTCRGCCTCRTRISSCGRCPASAVPMLRLQPDATFVTVLHPLRCTRCGSRADRVLLENQAPDWRRRVIRLWGRGAHA
jgi:hypothetical protein